MQPSEVVTRRSVVPDAAPAIEIRGLSKSYGAVRALRGLDLTVSPGEIVAVLGPNGAGKSTANEMILGLAQPDAGSVSVFGMSPHEAVRRGAVGAMLQAGALLSDTSVKDLLALMHGLHARPLPLPEIVERADLASFLATKTDKLSGGQAQRLRYALAIMPDPELLILDEPTVAMDVEIRRAFWASMQDFTDGGRTVLFATHYLEEADAVADRIVVLAAGQVVADGTGAEIRSLVAGRTVAVAADSVDVEVVRTFPGVAEIETSGARLKIHATDSDQVLRQLLDRCPQVRDIEVTSAKLEDAFLSLTSTHQPDQEK
ncbi:MAG TPA: ABC transporter ATP-binding protein [Propionibacteriaceae bacterium]